MSEKTSEEKLREELEGNSLTGDSPHSSRQRGVRRRMSSGTGRNIGQRVDSFIDDFERKIEESLGGGNARTTSSRQDRTRTGRRTETVNPKVPEVKEATVKPKAPVNPPEPDIPHDTKPEREIEVIPESPRITEEHSEPEAEHQLPLLNETINEIPQVIPEVEPEPRHEEPLHVETVSEIPIYEPEPEVPPQVETVDDIPQVISETEPEINEPEDETLPEEPEHTEHEELPDIPLIDSEPSDENYDDELPDIPVISADEVEEPDEDEELEEFDDIPVIDTEEVDEPEDESEPAETESYEPDETDYDIPEAMTEDEGPEPESEPEPDEPEDISSPADIVVNVDEDLPQIIDVPEPEPDPEAEAAPVSVTMPESTKTAEDKLMADIAEAMTGNPLTLDSKESPEPYRLPENFFTSQDTNADSSQQSAEDKLKANIAQAMSESPLGIAQQQAMQDLEQDLNPFDDISLPDFSERKSPGIDESESEPEPEPENEPEEEKEEEFLPDFKDEPQSVSTDPEDIPDMPDITGTEPEEENDDDDDSNPFDVEASDESEDEPEEPYEPNEQPEQETNLEELPLSDDDIADDEPLVETDSALEVVSLDKPESESEDETEQESDSEHLTAQQRLEQEIAQFTQDAPEENEHTDTDTQQEEAVPENNMPESLLDENEQQVEDDEIGDDWDINSLGFVSEAASLPDDEPEEIPEPEPETEFMNETEETHKEKTMGIREKLAARKNGASPKESSSPAPAKKSSSSPSSSSGGGILLPLLLGLLLVIGGLTFWQLYTLPDKIASVMASFSGGGFEPVSGIETNPSYDYAIDFILDPNIVERMAQRGREGWQVVGSRRTQDSTTGQYGYEIIFMRRIPGR